MVSAEYSADSPQAGGLSKEDAQASMHKKAVSALKKVWHVPGLTPEQRSAHARGINERLRALECEMGLSELSSRPAIIELPVAGNCNLRCEMCSLAHGAPTYKFWGLRDIESFSELFKYSQSINPTGVGEPLMGREFFPMLERFKRDGNSVGFYTNATLLDDKKIDRLIDLKVDHINISIDGATAETFERIRRNAKFEVVIANVRRLVARKSEREADLPVVHIAMVLMKDTIHEFPALIKLAHELGVFHVYAAFVGRVVPAFQPRLVQNDPRRTNEFLMEGKRVAGELGVHLWTPALLPEAEMQGPSSASSISSQAADQPAPSGPNYCAYPWTQYLVHNDGGVSACCLISGKVDDQPLGNASEGKPEDHWNSPGMIRLRKRLIEGNPPPICRNCTLRSSRAT